MTSATEKHPCDMGIDFKTGECPDYGSMDCPKTVPGAECGVDMKYAKELIELFEENHRWHVRSIEEVNQQLNERIKELEDKVRRQAESIGEWELRCESTETERDEWKTKCETREFAYKQADAERKRYSEQIDELRAEIATLKEHRAGNMERLHELTDECAELRKYRDELKGLAEKYRADSIAAQAETERYRAKLGDVLDALHEAERAAR